MDWEDRFLSLTSKMASERSLLGIYLKEEGRIRIEEWAVFWAGMTGRARLDFLNKPVIGAIRNC